jgi:RNA 3'-phosphate cyclase
MSWVAIDGSKGEGGGQIVRTALAMSAITGRPCRLTGIRARRPKPGLAAQHVAAIQAAQTLSDAAVEGLKPGSTELRFRPGPIHGGDAHFDVGTAGATTLVLQTVIPIALLAPDPVEITVTGGTDVPWSPPVDYCRGVFLAHLARLGARVKLEVLQRGAYPKGGGRIRLRVEPWAGGEPIELIGQGIRPRVEVTSMAEKTLAAASVAERQLEGFEPVAREEWGRLKTQAFYERMRSPGTSISARVVTDRTVLGVSVLGERRKRAERVGFEAATLLREEWASGAAVDRWMADQIIPFLGLLSGVVQTSEITSHTETNLWVVERFLPIRFEVDGTTIRASRGARRGRRSHGRQVADSRSQSRAGSASPANHSAAGPCRTH